MRADRLCLGALAIFLYVSLSSACATSGATDDGSLDVDGGDGATSPGPAPPGGDSGNRADAKGGPPASDGAPRDSANGDDAASIDASGVDATGGLPAGVSCQKD